MIIDATDLIVGRMASIAAKKAMLGEKIDIINCQNAVISGSRKNIIANYKQKKARATVFKGPYIPRMPDRFVRRIIRGMLPYKKEKGRKAFERIMCYIGVPKEFEGKKAETIDNASISKRNLTRFVRISDLCSELGAKI